MEMEELNDITKGNGQATMDDLQDIMKEPVLKKTEHSAQEVVDDA